MMTSTVRRTFDPKPGLTLLELVIALMIGILLIGGAAGVMVFSSDEVALKKAAREVESLAKRARTTAVLKQTPYALEFTPGMVRLMPLAEALNVEDEVEHLDDEIKEEDTGAVRWELSLDNGMGSQMRRWDTDEWIVIQNEERQLWRFDPNGLCEPIGLELWLEDGRISMEFNPLTAAISTTTYQGE